MMVSVNISLPSDVLAILDKERRWITRSEAIAKVLQYVAQTEGTIRNLVGANNVPPEYQITTTQ